MTREQTDGRTDKDDCIGISSVLSCRHDVGTNKSHTQLKIDAASRCSLYGRSSAGNPQIATAPLQKSTIGESEGGATETEAILVSLRSQNRIEISTQVLLQAIGRDY